MMAGASVVQMPRLQPAASWPASRLIHRPVVDVRQAAQVGAVVDIVFSAEARQLVGLLVGTSAAEGGFLELARRVLGSDVGLVFVPMERVIALSGDVVMISSEAHPSGEVARPLPPLSLRTLPRVRRSLGFAVYTMQGQRLGILADLQVDAEGRRVKGYIVSRAAAPVPAPATLPGPQPAQGPVGAPAGGPQQAGLAVAPISPVAPPAELFMIPVRFRVRFGRGLIVVGEDVSRPVVPSIPKDQSPAWPAPTWADEAPASAAGPASPTAPPAAEPPVSPDAPTEELSPPA
jgi:sporulation protein YlmC with PRC-barrel domain